MARGKHSGKRPEIRHLQGLTLVPYFLSPGPICQHSACEPMEAVPRQIIAKHLFQPNLVSSAERNGEIMLSACQVTSRIIAQMTTSHWASRWEVFDVKQGRWVVMWTSPFQGPGVQTPGEQTLFKLPFVYFIWNYQLWRILINSWDSGSD